MFRKKNKSKNTSTEIDGVEEVPEPIESPIDDSRDEITDKTDAKAVTIEETTMSDITKDDTTVDATSVRSNGTSTVHTVDSQEQNAQDPTETEGINDDTLQEFDEIKYQRVDTLTADITLPPGAKEGDIIDIYHDGKKQIKVPAGQKGGDSILVKMVSSKRLLEDEAVTPFCGCLSN